MAGVGSRFNNIQKISLMIKKLLLSLFIPLFIGNTGWAQEQSSIHVKQIPANAAKKDSLAILKSEIITGYYALPKRYISASVGTLFAPSIKEQQLQSFKDAMQGQIAGVQVTRANGMPAGETTVRVRGTSSIFAETEPLYLVNGVPIYAGPRELPNIGPGAGWGSVFSPLSDFNPNDIESITVLKDVAATAIYGARGANGVILINTKKGIKGQSSIDIDYSQGVTSATNQVNTLNGIQYLSALDQSWVNSGQTGQGPFPVGSGLTRGVANLTNTDQMGKILRTGNVQQMSFASSYGSDVTSFYFSGSYHNEAGILSGNNITRYTGNMNVTNQLSKQLMFGANVRMNFSDYFNMPVGYAPGGGFNAAQTNLPVYPFYQPSGLYFYEADPTKYNVPGNNVAAFQDKNEFDNSEHTKRLFLSSFLNYQFFPGLDFKTEGAWDQYFQTRTDYLSKRTRNGSIGSGNGVEGFPTAYAGYEKYTENDYNLRSTLTYQKSKGNYNFTALGGFEFNHNSNPYFFAEGEGFANDFARQPASAAYRNVITDQATTTNISSFVSYFANANLVWKGRYMASATVRDDGSSRFGAYNKYFTYPAGSLGWIISNERFFNKEKSGIEFLKLRVSYGTSGNLGIGNYSSLEMWNLTANSRYLLEPGLQMQSLGSPALKPERVDQLDIGLDFTILKGRLSGTADFYNKVTNDMLLQYKVPLSAGVVNPGLLLNAGSMRNRGVELSLSSKNLTGRFTWNSSLSLAHNANEVLNLGGLQPTQIGANKNIATFVGHPLSTFYLASYAGVDPNTGQELIYDINHNKVAATSAAQIDAARVAQFDKPSAPKIFGGLTNTFKYKGFDLSVLLSFSYGNYVLDEGERRLSYLSGDNNLRQTAVNAWTPQLPNTIYPRLLYNDPISNSNTTRFLHDASYLRGKYLTLGYDFKRLIKNYKFLRDARVYITAENFFTVTKFTGWDPEVAGNYYSNADRSLNQGITYLDVPQIRTFAAGFNLKF
jgi:TonB-linked SusC/RagA family outer membrane protein